MIGGVSAAALEFEMSSGEHNCGELRLRLLKDEIAAQANTFDQIDSKTGVALGFTFVVVGQVLAAVFRMATDQGRFRTLHPVAVATVFSLANIFVLLAIISGAISRWPRGFHHSFEWEPGEVTSPYLQMLESACNALAGIIASNHSTLGEKSSWAKRTYLFVGLALVAYLALTTLLFWFSVPGH